MKEMRNIKKKKRKLKWWVQSLITSVTIVVTLGFLNTSGFVSANVVEGDSMKPNFHTGNLVLTSKLFKINRYDVVTATSPSNVQVIKRVIGLPGETIRYDGKHVYVNGELAKEDFVLDKETEDVTGIDTEISEFYLSTLQGEITLGDDEYFLVGDNRGNSTDSRAYGGVKEEAIHGKVFAIDS